MVRIALAGRRVGGWIVDTDVDPPAGVTLAPLAKVSGWGPSADLVELSGWAAWRWAGPRTAFLRSASPANVVRSLPARTPGTRVHSVVDSGVAPLITEAFDARTAVLRLPPTTDRFPVALAAASLGNALILVPSLTDVGRLAARMRRAGIEIAVMPRDWAAARRGATAIGTRSAAWAPVEDLAAVVVFDEHDEVYQQEQAPTWHARDVVLERARRSGVPLVLVSPTPSLEALSTARLVAPSRAVERDGWPIVDIVDRREEDPVRAGLYSPQLAKVLRGDARVVCVVNRKGRSRLLVCAGCGEVARCESCAAAVDMTDSAELSCPVCGATRPVVCTACGRTTMKNLRAGVTRVREELEALAHDHVVEVTGETKDIEPGRIHVGTEAVLHRIHKADVVAFLDFDQELLAPRYRAAEEALALIVRAARLVGGRSGAGRVMIQTRLADHEVLQAALHADPARVAAAERIRRDLLRFPPASNLVVVSGAAAGDFIDALGRPEGVEVMGPSDGRWLLRAQDRRCALDALAATQRPPGRLRVEVDPLRF